MWWIYKYMQAGGRCPAGLDALATLPANALVLIYQHSIFLGYEALMKRVYGRLKSNIYHCLPMAHEMQLLQKTLPPLYEFAVYCLARDMVNPWACDYSQYTEFAQTDPVFGAALDNAMQKLLAARVKAGKEYYALTKNRSVRWAKQYVDSVLAGKVPPKKPVSTSRFSTVAPEVSGSGIAMQISKDSTIFSHKYSLKVDREKKKPRIRYKCSEQGHIARHCTAKPIPDSAQSETDHDNPNPQK